MKTLSGEPRLISRNKWYFFGWKFRVIQFPERNSITSEKLSLRGVGGRTEKAENRICSAVGKQNFLKGSGSICFLSLWIIGFSLATAGGCYWKTLLCKFDSSFMDYTPKEGLASKDKKWVKNLWHTQHRITYWACRRRKKENLSTSTYWISFILFELLKMTFPHAMGVVR